jgi:hypothetical protein
VPALLKPLDDVAGDVGIGPHLLEPYGESVVKVKLAAIDELADVPEPKVRGRDRRYPDAARRGEDHHHRGGSGRDSGTSASGPR